MFVDFIMLKFGIVAVERLVPDKVKNYITKTLHAEGT
jgi:hypothetical protein